MLGRAGRRIPSAHGNCSLFSLVYFYYTTTIFSWGEREEFPLRTGAISLFSSTTLPMPVLFMWGERAGEFLLRTVTALFFSLVYFYYTTTIFSWERERNSLFAQGRFHYSLLLLLPMPVLFMWGERAGEFLLHTITALFFSLVYFYYTTTIFMLGEGEEFARHSPPPRFAPYRECTITVECKKAMMCVAGIRQTLLSATLCFLPRVYKYHRMQEEPHSLRRRNSSDLTS